MAYTISMQKNLINGNLQMEARNTIFTVQDYVSWHSYVMMWHKLLAHECSGKYGLYFSVITLFDKCH